MRILVIGGAGYIGSHAVRKLIENGDDVVVLDALYTGHKKAVDKRATFYQGDIEDTFLVNKILREEKIDAVMHFAAYSLVGESVQNPLKYYDNNVTGMISLLQAMQDAGVKHLVFSSSAATYGIPKKLPITEDTPLDPINPYGETKMMMEKIMHWADKANGIKSIALRYFNVAGAASDGTIGEDHGPESHLVPNILKSALAGDGNFTIFGDDYDTKDGTNVRDYVQVEDLIDAHILALQHLIKTNKSDIFNLGTAQGYSNLEILESAKKVTGIDIPYKIGPRRGGDPDSLVADSTKARTILGWKPKHENVDEVIATAWKWHQTHPNGYADK
ncbi:UDP-glucose 4-epimerase GalE [Lactobacillus sp. PV037]|uniref:UDP-glucose 4-epimerase GalE n=1 Tax=unclassified Lactobacillus TaxID=2620435 RepID=UPI00223FF7E8|nr:MULTISPECIES: UDP-glucose 4-epimerase GalE [unclassified Lactobacillus]QNQ82709.1 UDP-glucose 4-epimerase GalE [Lactobacillus sp. PV012]QNQ83172.1 UDP-glucose 4-epimerase GalE [Lactobacillus sp. PV037]